MAIPFVGEVRLWAFDFEPRGWTVCDGHLLPISQNNALFSILGTAFGGDGQSTFAVPNFASRAPRHAGLGPGTPYIQHGSRGGVSEVTLTESEMPYHTHQLSGDDRVSDHTAPSATTMVGIYTGPGNAYSTQSPNTTMNSHMLQSVGDSEAHENRQPFLVLNFCLALDGIYPARN